MEDDHYCLCENAARHSRRDPYPNLSHEAVGLGLVPHAKREHPEHVEVFQNHMVSESVRRCFHWRLVPRHQHLGKFDTIHSIDL